MEEAGAARCCHKTKEALPISGSSVQQRSDKPCQLPPTHTTHWSLHQPHLCFHLPVPRSQLSSADVPPSSAPPSPSFSQLCSQLLPSLQSQGADTASISPFSNGTAPPASFPANNYAFCFIPGIASLSFKPDSLTSCCRAVCLPQVLCACHLLMTHLRLGSLQTPPSFCGTERVAGTPGKPNTQTAPFPPVPQPLSAPCHHQAWDSSLFQGPFPPLLICCTVHRRVNKTLAPTQALRTAETSG